MPAKYVNHRAPLVSFSVNGAMTSAGEETPSEGGLVKKFSVGFYVEYLLVGMLLLAVGWGLEQASRASGRAGFDHLTGMPIIVRLDVALARRKMSLTELAEAVDITMAYLSILKTGKAKAIRFSTLEAICSHLGCQPGDILEYAEDTVPARLPKNSDSKEPL